ncbi:MarR family transcriptional regulator [Paenibacillus sp. PK3_47]|uniref:MarR family winged helix-turn-helix transcriptional regulator n=1 Tax=Paenibacillus sp. PK3_47 TaxID=2072642 RepID=UPI00201D5BC5|nr:MarR family winged helix-turn-helix transcriptional regulator [Paenibacillus sp. PK3_47]UQZ36950.1 MarR family transcriptional regulator [Paenibacillus sp. PK3_47]
MDHESLSESADTIGLFCRLHMNAKKNLPVRSSEMGVLIYTGKQEVPVTPLMISSFFKVAKPTVTVLINTLIQQDYLSKTMSSTDGRSYTVSLTPKGAELVRTASSVYFYNLELLEKQMGGEDFQTFISLMMKANEILLHGEG